MVNINAEPKPSYELTEEELDKATGGREGPRAPDQPDRDHQGCGQPIAQAVGARRTSDAAFQQLESPVMVKTGNALTKRNISA